MSKYTKMWELDLALIGEGNQLSSANLTAQGYDVEFVEGEDRTEVVLDETGELATRVFYPAGQISNKHSGYQGEFHFGGKESKRMRCSYDFKFESGFSFGGETEGGKMPGLTNTERCQPEFYNNGYNGFSTRPMWYGNSLDFDWVPAGKVTLVGYWYYLREPYYEEDGTTPVMYGSDTQANRKDERALLESNKWYSIIQEVQINSSPTANDGWCRYYIHSEDMEPNEYYLFISQTGMRWTLNDKHIDTFFFSTFHGGSTEAFAPIEDSYALFKNMQVEEWVE